MNNTREDFNDYVISGFSIFVILMFVFIVVFCSFFIHNIKKQEDKKFKVYPIVPEIQEISIEIKTIN